MVVYHTDYSRSDERHAVAWVKRTGKRSKIRTQEVEKIIPGDFVNGSFSGEILGIYFALLDAVTNRYSNVKIVNDNKVVIEILNRKKRKTRRENVKFLLYLVDTLRKKISKVQFEWIPRQENKDAHSAARTGLSK